MQPFIHRMMDSLRKLFRFWKTCYESVFKIFVETGTNIYHLQSLFLITVFKPISEWHHSRRCMKNRVDRLFVGLKQAKQHIKTTAGARHH